MHLPSPLHTLNQPMHTISKLAKSQDIELSIAIFIKRNLPLQYMAHKVQL